MFMKYQEKRKELIKLGKYIMDRDLTWGNAGNISMRTSDDSCLITASGTHLGELSAEDFLNCGFAETETAGSKKPSKETPMHTGIYEIRPEIQVVIHASPFYSTLISASELEIPTNSFVEGMYYLERIERVPYFHPGSLELAEGVKKACRNSNIILLENHGVVVYENSLKEAKTALITLENACKMAITARTAGIEIKSVSSETVKDFLENSGYKQDRKWKS